MKRFMFVIGYIGLCEGFLHLHPPNLLLGQRIKQRAWYGKFNPRLLLQMPCYSDALVIEVENNNKTVLIDTNLLSLNETHLHHLSAAIIDNPQVTEQLEQIQKQSHEVIQQLKTKSNRKQLFLNAAADTKTIVFTLLKNIRNGEYGKRGEELLFTQLALLGFVFFGMNSFLTIGIKIFSFISFFYGIHLLFRGVFDLKEQLSPYTIPGKEHRIVSSGIYEQVRHPIYGGMMLLALGMSIIAKDVYKLSVAIMLGLVLVSICWVLPSKY